MLGAAGAFLIVRYLGRECAAALIGDRLKKYDDAIERNGRLSGSQLAVGFSRPRIAFGGTAPGLPGKAYAKGSGQVRRREKTRLLNLLVRQRKLFDYF